jgi:hypothetical protein
MALNEVKNGATGDQWWYMRPDGKIIWQASVTEEPTFEMFPIAATASERAREMRESCVLR